MRRTLPILTLLTSAVAHAQAPATEARPKPVDQGVADLDGLSRSLRVVETGLQHDQNFRNLYEVPGRPDLLMRRSGSTVIVFPRSAYIKTRDGTFPIIPAGATFYIGSLPQSVTGPGGETGALPSGALSKLEPPRAYSPLRHAGQVSGRLDLRTPLPPAGAPAPIAAPPPEAPPDQAEPPAQTQTQPMSAPPPTVFTNETYRKLRMAEILSTAHARPLSAAAAPHATGS